VTTEHSGHDWVFCKIAAGQAPASVVYEDDELTTIMDLRPVTTGHVLVLPKAHSVGLADLPADLGARMFQVAQQVAAAMRGSGMRCEGINLFLADGVAAGQEVFHVHLHVIPRYAGDGFRVSAGTRVQQRGELDSMAATLRKAW
jgi:diadenosine tetraphosphate (Ap4A) HIT family hydrolase